MTDERLTEKETGRLRSCPLLKGLSDEELPAALSFFHAAVKSFRKGEYLKTPGSGGALSFFGLVLSGTVLVYMDDLDGNRMVMASVGEGMTFGESLCFLGKPSPVYIQAGSDARVLLMDCKRLRGKDLSLALGMTEKAAMTERAAMTEWAGKTEKAAITEKAGRNEEALADRLRDSFLAMICERTLAMNNRIQVLSKLTLREKILTFLSEMPEAASGKPFVIPMNREDMAAYLGANRSAISRELSALKKEGVLDYYKNTFRILR